MLPSWTESEKKVLKLFSDGLAHTRAEIVIALNNPCDIEVLKKDKSVWRAALGHIIRMRIKLGFIGQDIICVSRGTSFYYQHVRLLAQEHITG